MKTQEEAIIYAKKYIEDLLSFFGINTDVYTTTEDGMVIEMHVPSTHINSLLIGNHGETMRSLQYMVSMALRSGEYPINRVSVDIADYKKQRAERLKEKAKIWIEEVKNSGSPKSLEPMNAADRRTIHKLAEEYSVVSESAGVGRNRHVVIKPQETQA